MQVLSFLLVCSQALAFLMLSGEGFMSVCSDIVMIMPISGTEHCPTLVSPDRVKCIAENELALEIISACAIDIAAYGNVTDEELYSDVKTYATNMHWLNPKVKKSTVYSAFASAQKNYQNWPVLNFEAQDAAVQYINYTNEIDAPVQLPEYIFEFAFPATQELYTHQVLSRNMGCGILAYWGAIFLIRAFVLFSYRYAPVILKAGDGKLTRLLRKYIILPPLLRFHHASPYRIGRYFTFQLPTRVTSLAVVGFVAVNYVLMFVHVPSSYPGEITSVPLLRNGYSFFLASRSAQLVLYKLPIIFLFCGRNNFLLYTSGWSMNEFSIFHKWVGRVAFIDTIIHAATATDWSKSVGFYTLWTRHSGQLKWGISALCVFAFIFLQSIHWLRRLNYELFKYLHMALSLVFLALSWQHILYSYYGRPYMYACWAIWIFDHVIRWTRILISGFCKATFVYHGGVLEITIEHSNWWQPRGGNHAFIHVLTRDKFWQSHPFSLMRAIKVGEENKVKIIARAKDGITRDWVERCIKNGGSFDSRVLIDGPYGTPRNFKFFEELVFIAGGIGISSPYAYLQNKVRRDAHQTISLYWGIPNEEPLTWFSTELEYLANSGKFTIHIFVGLDPGDNGSIMAPGDQFLSQFNSDSSLGANEKDPFKTSLQGNVHFYSHQMDVPAVIADHIINAAGPTAFMTCGPADMNDTSRSAFVQNFEKSRYLCEHFEEHFSW